MKIKPSAILAAGVAGMLLLPVQQVFAKGSPSGGTPSCLVSKADRDAITLRGTIAVEATSNIDGYGAQDVDFTLRLQRGGVTQFFRLHLTTPINGLSSQELACRLLNPNDTGDPAVQTAVATLQQQILGAFGLSINRQFVITNRSIDAEEPQTTDKTIPGTDHASSLADIKFHAQ